MSNLVFPVLPGMSFPVVKTPTWRNKIQEAVSGKEVRIGFWTFPKWKWSLVYEFLRDRVAPKDELWQILGFFNKHQGGFDSWLFDDPDDNAVVVEAFGVGNATRTQFQLVRSRGGFVEPVRALNGAPLIYKAGVLQTVTTHYTISSSGLVTFVTAPGAAAALTWTGGYYWRCRFAADSADVSKFAKELWEMQKIEFVSVK